MMNICNFAKVICARSMKEIRQDPGVDTPPKYHTNLSMKYRYNMYTEIMSDWKRMQFEKFDQFRNNLRRIEEYLSNRKYWTGNNSNGEKQVFLKSFSLASWEKLKVYRKKLHTLRDCTECSIYDWRASTSHRSSSSVNNSMSSLLQHIGDIVPDVDENRNLSYVSKSFAASAAEEVISLINPAFENCCGLPVEEAMMIPRKKQARIEVQEVVHKEVKSVLVKSSQAIQHESEDAVIHAASFTESDAQYERNRLNLYHVSQKAAKANVDTRKDKVAQGIMKRRKGVGNFSSYSFEKEDFLERIQKVNPGEKVVWKQWAEEFNVTNVAGLHPANGGQVLKEFATANGIDVDSLNVTSRISGHDYNRIRRPKKRAHGTCLSIPQPRSIKKIKQDIDGFIQDGKICLGDPIAPKKFISQTVGESGDVINREVLVYGRKISLNKVRELELHREEKMGLLREMPTKLTINDVVAQLKRYNRYIPSDTEAQCRMKLEEVMTTRHLKVWADHSCITSHSYFLVMVSVMYDPAVFITDEEYRVKFKVAKSVQSLVEVPRIYILGLSDATEVEQAMYYEPIHQDLLKLDQPVYTEDNIAYSDTLRFFVGDLPGRESEAGQQRGGNNPCPCGALASRHSDLKYSLQFIPPVIEDQRDIALAGDHESLIAKLKKGCLYPFHNLSRKELEYELELREFDLDSRT